MLIILQGVQQLSYRDQREYSLMKKRLQELETKRKNAMSRQSYLNQSSEPEMSGNNSPVLSGYEPSSPKVMNSNSYETEEDLRSLLNRNRINTCGKDLTEKEPVVHLSEQPNEAMLNKYNDLREMLSRRNVDPILEEESSNSKDMLAFNESNSECSDPILSKDVVPGGIAETNPEDCATTANEEQSTQSNSTDDSVSSSSDSSAEEDNSSVSEKAGDDYSQSKADNYSPLDPSSYYDEIKAGFIQADANIEKDKSCQHGVGQNNEDGNLDAPIIASSDSFLIFDVKGEVLPEIDCNGETTKEEESSKFSDVHETSEDAKFDSLPEIDSADVESKENKQPLEVAGNLTNKETCLKVASCNSDGIACDLVHSNKSPLGVVNEDNINVTETLDKQFSVPTTPPLSMSSPHSNDNLLKSSVPKESSLLSRNKIENAVKLKQMEEKCLLKRYYVIACIYLKVATGSTVCI